MAETAGRVPSPHTCHAIGCTKSVPPSLFACGHHWMLLPIPLRHAIWRAYRTDQEIDKQPSSEYLDAANAARHWLHRAEKLPGTLCAICTREGEDRAVNPRRPTIDPRDLS